MKIDKEIGLTDMIVKIGLSVIELERDMTMGIESETTEEETDNKNGLVQDRWSRWSRWSRLILLLSSKVIEWCLKI